MSAFSLDASSWSPDWQADHELVAVLEESRRLGFLGPGPLDVHIEHALAMAEAAAGLSGAGETLDLGSGGGVPGLVIARLVSSAAWTLLDSQQRRTEFLAAAVQRLGLDDRVSVLRARAEDAGRSLEYREHFILVTARSFGSPAVTVECAAPLLRLGGWLVVSEPPGAAGERWPAAPLAELGLYYRQAFVGERGFAVLEKVAASPEWAPRRVGQPAKRPFF